MGTLLEVVWIIARGILKSPWTYATVAPLATWLSGIVGKALLRYGERITDVARTNELQNPDAPGAQKLAKVYESLLASLQIDLKAGEIKASDVVALLELSLPDYIAVDSEAYTAAVLALISDPDKLPVIKGRLKSLLEPAIQEAKEKLRKKGLLPG